ncbi:hypothetical protein DXG01_004114 [Tephrocybe rancida]|nr:hypothetical protein DXG01_004114 [Tephrocybe rancida]
MAQSHSIKSDNSDNTQGSVLVAQLVAAFQSLGLDVANPLFLATVTSALTSNPATFQDAAANNRGATTTAPPVSSLSATVEAAEAGFVDMADRKAFAEYVCEFRGRQHGRPAQPGQFGRGAVGSNEVAHNDQATSCVDHAAAELAFVEVFENGHVQVK